MSFKKINRKFSTQYPLIDNEYNDLLSVLPNIDYDIKIFNTFKLIAYLLFLDNLYKVSDLMLIYF